MIIQFRWGMLLTTMCAPVITQVPSVRPGPNSGNGSQRWHLLLACDTLGCGWKLPNAYGSCRWAASTMSSMSSGQTSTPSCSATELHPNSSAHKCSVKQEQIPEPAIAPFGSNKISSSAVFLLFLCGCHRLLSFTNLRYTWTKMILVLFIL